MSFPDRQPPAGAVLPFPDRYDPGGRRWEPWVSDATVARHYSVSARTVRRWRSAGMPSRLIGRARRYRLSDVDAWHAAADGG